MTILHWRKETFLVKDCKENYNVSRSYLLKWSSRIILIMAHCASARTTTSRTSKSLRKRYITSEIENIRAGSPHRSLWSMNPHSLTGFGDANRSSSRISATRRADPSVRSDLEESDRWIARERGKASDVRSSRCWGTTRGAFNIIIYGMESRHEF